MEQLRTIIKKNGVVAIPAKYRKILGLKIGDEVTLLIQAGEIRIVPRLQALQQAQAIVRRFIPEGRSLADELMQDRRVEARVNEVMLDASVLLALLNAEAGAEEASRYIAMGIMSTVNLSEVVAKLSENGMPEEAIREVINLLPMKFVPFDEHLSYGAGLLRPVTKERGLSLGDRGVFQGDEMSHSKIEYTAELLPDGHLSVPDDIKERLVQMKGYTIKVRIELPGITKAPISACSFLRARKLLASIPGELSADIIMEREDRV